MLNHVKQLHRKRPHWPSFLWKRNLSLISQQQFDKSERCEWSHRLDKGQKPGITLLKIGKGERNHKREEQGMLRGAESKAKLMPTIPDQKTQCQNTVMQVVVCFETPQRYLFLFPPVGKPIDIYTVEKQGETNDTNVKIQREPQDVLWVNLGHIFKTETISLYVSHLSLNWHMKVHSTSCNKTRVNGHKNSTTFTSSK